MYWRTVGAGASAGWVVTLGTRVVMGQQSFLGFSLNDAITWG